MSYIDRNLLPDERIVFRTKKHVIIFLFPIILLILSWAAFQYMQGNFILQRVEWIIPLLALLYFSSVWLEYITSEFVVTTRRIVMREGFFVRHTTDLRIHTISQINVNQSLIAQMLDYGNISINAFGATDIFSMIAHPVAFQKYSNEQLDKAVG